MPTEPMTDERLAEIKQRHEYDSRRCAPPMSVSWLELHFLRGELLREVGRLRAIVAGLPHMPTEAESADVGRATE